ncbi:MAG TPA: hypothetical protein VMV35_01540 [Halothiobacillus sp.]|nr:hypothetical protein [Halothiobacillus sp.]
MSTPDFNSLFEQFHDQVPNQQMQREVASVIGQCLEQVKDRLTYWEKTHIASALSSLAWNLRSKNNPTDAWLRLSLANAEKSLIAPSHRSDSYTRKDESIDDLTYEKLKEDLGQLLSEIGQSD